MEFESSRREVLATALLSAVPLPTVAATVDGSAINFVDTGPSNKPVMVFIHGYTCSLRDWSLQIEALAPTHRCIAIDLPGHGKTPRPREATNAAMADAVIATLQSLRLEKVVLVGHSMGCRVVSETYSRIPSRIGGIAWLEGSLLATNDPAANLKRTADYIDKIGMTAFYDRTAEQFVFVTTPPSVRAYIKASRPNIEADPEFWRDFFLDLMRWDEMRSRAVLRSIKVPALLVQSTLVDATLQRVPLGPNAVTPWMEEVSKSVKPARIERVLGSGHFVMLEKSGKVNELLASFSRAVNEA